MDNILYAKVQSDIKKYEDAHPSSRDFYRNYTKSLMDRFRIEIIDGEDGRIEIPVMYANPERAIAKVQEDRNLKLPLISVAIGDIEENIKARKPVLHLSHCSEPILLIYAPFSKRKDNVFNSIDYLHFASIVFNYFNHLFLILTQSSFRCESSWSFDL